MGCFNIIQCVQPVGLVFAHLGHLLRYDLRLVFAPHARGSQVLSQQRSDDGCLTLLAERMFALGILSYWRAYLDLFVLGTVRGYFLLFEFQGLSAYLSALL